MDGPVPRLGIISEPDDVDLGLRKFQIAYIIIS